MTSPTTSERVARTLLEIDAVRFRPEAPFTLGSGRSSPVFVDCRRLIGFPRARARVMDLALSTLADEIGSEAFDAVAGGETAGIPFAAWLADRLMLPMLYVRKTPKGFGRNARIEGRLAEGQRVLLVDDIAADGTAKLAFVDALREAGAHVAHVLVIVDFDLFPESRTAVAGAGITVHRLATVADILAVARRDNSLPPSVIAGITAFQAAPSPCSPAG